MNNKSKRLNDHYTCGADHTLTREQWLAASAHLFARWLQRQIGEAAVLLCHPDFPQSMSLKVAPVPIIICTLADVRRTASRYTGFFS